VHDVTGRGIRDHPTYPASGWIEAMLYVTTVGVLALVYAVAHTYGAHPIAFILYAMLVSAIVMLAWSGMGSDCLVVMLHPKSWLIGATIILIEVFYFVMLGYVSPLHGTIAVRIGIPMAMVAGVLLYGRKPPRLAALGAGAALIIIVLVIAGTGPNERLPMAMTASLIGFFIMVRGFASEFHPWNRAAKTVREKIRVTGLVVLATSIMSLLATASAAALIGAELMPKTPLVPTLADLLHMPTILLGVLVGTVLLTTMAYLNFSAVVKITTENFMAMMAFTPLTAWIMQMLGTSLGLISAPRAELWLVAAMFALIACVLTIFWAGRGARPMR
jgi:hypothetical protein